MARGRKGLGVEPRTECIRLSFTLADGERVRETLDWPPTSANIKRAHQLAALVRRDIAAGALDEERYRQYFPNSKRLPKSSSSTTLKGLADLYLKTCGQLSANTLAQYRIQIAFWKELLGSNRRMDSFRHSELKAIIGAYKWQSWRHHNNYIIPLRGIFALWVADDPLHRPNPLTGIKNLKKVKGEEKIDKADALSEAEERAVLARIAVMYDQQIYNYFDFAFATGLRPECEIELKWADIDLEANPPVARITRARSKGEVRPPKNHERRTVELSPRAVEALRRQRAFTEGREDDYVFVNPDTGRPWADTAAQRKRWNRVLKSLGMRHLTPYSTRHTRATRMLMAKPVPCNPAWCAQQLGHTVEMFYRIYADWIDADDRGTELAKVDPPIRPVLVPGDAAAAEIPEETNGMDGRRDWTRTNDPHHVKVVL